MNSIKRRRRRPDFCPAHDNPVRLRRSFEAHNEDALSGRELPDAIRAYRDGLPGAQGQRLSPALELSPASYTNLEILTACERALPGSAVGIDRILSRWRAARERRLHLRSSQENLRRERAVDRLFVRCWRVNYVWVGLTAALVVVAFGAAIASLFWSAVSPAVAGWALGGAACALIACSLRMYRYSVRPFW